MADKRARYGRSRRPAAEDQRRAAVIEDRSTWRELLKDVVFVMPSRSFLSSLRGPAGTS